MVKQRSLLWAILVGVFAALLIPAVNADPIKKATDLAVFQPIEIPGMVLLPGDYVIKIPDPVTHADMVGFYNEDESKLIKLVRTIPKYRLEVTDRTVITFEERSKGAPDAIKSWFFPGDNWGREFVYGKAKPVTVAEAAPLPAIAAPEEALVPEPTAPAAVIEETPAPVAEAAPAEIAEAAPEVAEIAPAPIEELPKTGTSLPLAAVLGMCAVALGVALRRVS